MSQDRLQDLITQLRREVDALGADDRAARDRLDALTKELEKRFESPGDETLEAPEDFMETLRETVERFEVEHPRATGIVNSIMVTLGNMGI
jgi:predicted FMN-binding regulatory protein PaiB